MSKQILLFFIIKGLLISPNFLLAQKRNVPELFSTFSKYYSQGDFFKAETCLLKVLESKDSIQSEYLIAAYNNMGVIKNRFGRFDEALGYYNLAESILLNKRETTLELADVYNNKANIFGILKEYDKAIQYIEQGIKIYSNPKISGSSINSRMAISFTNLGHNFYESKNYKKALELLLKSRDIKIKYKLSDIAFTYLSLARIYVRLNDSYQAEDYFKKSIDAFNKEFGPNYYRTSSVLFDYGLFLRSKCRINESFIILQKALWICHKNYGEKHPFVSLGYKLLGDHFYYQTDYRTALQFYQKSLIAVVSDFSDTSIYSNPTLNSVIFNIRLLDNLKRKSDALEMYSLQQVNMKTKLRIMNASYETINLALQVVSKIRSDYFSIESKLYLAENEKETYINAIHVAQQLYELTKRPEYLERMYAINCLSKSAVLRDEISENELLCNKNMPDSIHLKRNNLQVQVSSYSKLIQDEIQKTKPDSQKLALWKDTQFRLSRVQAKFEETYKNASVQYTSLQQKTEPISLKEIQNYLDKDEMLIEYLISNQYAEGKRKMYTFTITKNRLDYQFTLLDSSFINYSDIIRNGTTNKKSTDISFFTSYTEALNYMFEKLIKPVEVIMTQNRIIIIPDEEISYLPFDSFIRKKPDSEQNSFDGLQYLIYDYTFSYGYSSSLIFATGKNQIKTQQVYAFLPDYGTNQEINVIASKSLQGAVEEVGSIFKEFDGKIYDNGTATESNFKSLIHNPAIYHLAMHSRVDSTNSKYSSLIFDTPKDTVDDGNLYNYEISMSSIVSPMVVLSACNTGTGNIYHGEGVMSLTRSFILAGASSVVNTFWDVNDKASARIIKNFYYNLSKGKEKDAALRIAKLNYLKNSPPTYTNPYYWAAYEVIGDKSPIRNNYMYYHLVIGLIIALSGGIYFAYFKRSRRS